MPHLSVIKRLKDMTTIKVKFRLSSVEGRPGTVYYRVSHRRCTKLITTHIRMLPYQWELLQKSVKQVVDKEWWYYTRRQLESDQNLLMQVVRMFDALGTEYSVNDVIKQYFEARKQIPFFEFMERQIAELLESGHRGTARGYRRSLSSFATYLGNNDIAFGMIDERLVMEYSDWLLRRGVVRNTVSFYMRNLRSVYNKAVKQGLAVQAFPFQRVYTGVDRTAKRAIDERTIVRLAQMQLHGSEELARDLFLFSYCTRGMSFVDMAYLRKSDIRRGTISYTRRKTKQRLVVKVEPCIERILKKYCREGSPYVFPIIRSHDAFAAYKDYQRALSYTNRLLRHIGEAMGLRVPLTTYVARHSWANSARKHKVPLDVISAGMGHTSEHTTRIYLTSLERAMVDEANSSIVALLEERRRR